MNSLDTRRGAIAPRLFAREVEVRQAFGQRAAFDVARAEHYLGLVAGRRLGRVRVVGQDVPNG